MQRMASPSRAVTIPDNMPHPSHELFELVQQFDAFPNGVTSIPKQLQGTSFFPAGVGLLVEKRGTELPRFPVGGIMVLAHDWGTVGDFELYEKEDCNNELLVELERWRVDCRFIHGASLVLWLYIVKNLNFFKANKSAWWMPRV